MKDPICILMGGLDILAGIIILSLGPNTFFMIVGILLALKGAMSFF